jgi:hypothetical protein
MTDLINELKKFILTGQALAEQGECLEPSIIDVLNEIERLEKGQTLPIDSVSDSTLIKPLSLELSQGIKNHIAELEHIKELINKMPSMLGIPEKYFN